MLVLEWPYDEILIIVRLINRVTDRLNNTSAAAFGRCAECSRLMTRRMGSLLVSLMSVSWSGYRAGWEAEGCCRGGSCESCWQLGDCLALNGASTPLTRMIVIHVPHRITRNLNVMSTPCLMTGSMQAARNVGNLLEARLRPSLSSITTHQ